MAVTIDPNVELITDTPVAPVQPPGSTLVVCYAFPMYFSIPDGELVNTTQMTLLSPTRLGYADFYNMAVAFNATSQRQAAAGNGNPEEVLVFYAYEETLFDVRLPTRVCLGSLCYDVPGQVCVPGTNWCIGLGGQELASLYKYTFWFLSHEVVYSGGYPLVTGRALVWGIPVIWAIIIGILAALQITAITVQLIRGSTTFAVPKAAVSQPGNPSGATVTKPYLNSPPPTGGPPPVGGGGGVPGVGTSELIAILGGGVLLAGAVAFAVSTHRKSGV